MMRRLLMIILSCVAIAAGAEDRWLHIYRTDNGRERVSAFPIEELNHSTFAQDGDGASVATMTMHSADGTLTDIDLCTVDSCVIGTNIPTIYIDIDNGEEITDKETWLSADIRIRGYGTLEDLGEAQVTVKGRGNSTFSMPKKPYAVKFSKKTQIGSLRKAKNFVLLANYIDNTLMRNAVALKIAQLMGMPYTNNFQPVNLMVNGTYRGSYLLTEKVGINSGSVDIDETKGILFELDTNYDEDYRFHSEVYDLPVMVKDPDFNDLGSSSAGSEPAEMLEYWQADFQALENAVAGVSGIDYTTLLDVESVANFMLVNCVCANREINHPKSLYIYKTGTTDKYHMGPVWDFDWAFTFDGYKEWSVPYSRTLITTGNKGGKFLKALVSNADFVWKYNARWKYFRDTVWPQVLDFMDEYADTITVSALQNGERWPQEDLIYSQQQSTETFRENYKRFRQWMQQRVDYLDGHLHLGLY